METKEKLEKDLKKAVRDFKHSPDEIVAAQLVIIAGKLQNAGGTVPDEVIKLINDNSDHANVDIRRRTLESRFYLSTNPNVKLELAKKLATEEGDGIWQQIYESLNKPPKATSSPKPPKPKKPPLTNPPNLEI